MHKIRFQNSFKKTGSKLQCYNSTEDQGVRKLQKLIPIEATEKSLFTFLILILM